MHAQCNNLHTVITRHYLLFTSHFFYLHNLISDEALTNIYIYLCFIFWQMLKQLDPDWTRKSSLEKLSTMALVYDYDKLDSDIQMAAHQMISDMLSTEQKTLISNFLLNVENLQQQDLPQIALQVSDLTLA